MPQVILMGSRNTPHLEATGGLPFIRAQTQLPQERAWSVRDQPCPCPAWARPQGRPPRQRPVLGACALPAPGKVSVHPDAGSVRPCAWGPLPPAAPADPWDRPGQEKAMQLMLETGLGLSLNTGGSRVGPQFSTSSFLHTCFPPTFIQHSAGPRGKAGGGVGDSRAQARKETVQAGGRAARGCPRRGGGRAVPGTSRGPEDRQGPTQASWAPRRSSGPLLPPLLMHVSLS